MKNFVIVVLVALAAIALLLFVYNPELLEKVWLWIVGLIGVIISAIKNSIDWLVNLGKDKKGDRQNSEVTASSVGPAAPNTIIDSAEDTDTISSQLSAYQNKIRELEDQILILENKLRNSSSHDGYLGTTLTVLRYFDDGATTLGLLFMEDEFFCYTLEDTHRDIKVIKETRIPQGTYELGFNREFTPLTEKYRASRPWFEYHLHIKNVPNYTGVYIHVGNTIKDTAGCLLVADDIESSNSRRAIFNSRATFKRLYLKLKPIIDAEKPVRIKYYNEDWFERFKLKRIVA